MTLYVDSSVLVAVYVPERFSKAARKAVRGVPQVPFTPLHELEVLNAFELLVGRSLITRDECRAIRAQLQADLESLRLARVPLDLDSVCGSATEFSRLYTSRFLTRSLDLLHVAAAQAMMCSTLVSADDRQLAVAKAAGLKVLDIKHRVGRKKS